MSAKNDAVSAKTDAETAKGQAQTAAGNASQSATNAANSATAAAEVMGGFTILWNYSAFTSQDNGEGYLCAFDPATGTKSDANGWVKWNGVKRTITKQMINPNTVLPYNIPIYVVCRLSSATATTGTNYMVWYNSGWKYAVMPTPSAVGGSWTWADNTDIILGKFVETASEAALTEYEIYNPPYTSKQITTNVVTAQSASANAASAAQTATTYITYVNATDGIKVHNASDTTNYLQLNSSAISMYKGSTKIFNVDNNGYVAVGKVGASKRNVYITDSAVQIRNNTSVLAEYGSDIRLGEVGTDKKNIYISPDTGIDIRNDTTSLANFSDTVRIGNDKETNIQITPTNVIMTAPDGSVALKMFFERQFTEGGLYEYGVRITDEHNMSMISITPATDINSGEFTNELQYYALMESFSWQISNASFSLTEQGFGASVGTYNAFMDTNGDITISNQSPFFYEDVVVTVSYAAGTIGTRGTQANCGTTAKSGYKYIGASVLSHTNTSLFSVNLIRNDSTANLHLMAYRASGNAVSDADVTVRKFWVNDHILDHY